MNAGSILFGNEPQYHAIFARKATLGYTSTRSGCFAGEYKPRFARWRNLAIRFRSRCAADKMLPATAGFPHEASDREVAAKQSFRVSGRAEKMFGTSSVAVVNINGMHETKPDVARSCVHTQRRCTNEGIYIKIRKQDQFIFGMFRPSGFQRPSTHKLVGELHEFSAGKKTFVQKFRFVLQE
ncbi:MAG TPA: hypothetical protein VJ904_06530, partial [Tichowtungia sp.]|nr:hypothetical protein [Tichowtungia sp.]